MKKIAYILILFFALLVNSAGTASAQSYVAESSATLKPKTAAYDYRIRVLKAYLLKHNSPLADYSEEFIKTADKYNIDWRLVPAISGVESTFGKRIPKNSFNAYGWANGKYSFNSWEHSIEVVSKTLRERYMDKGATSIGQIARIYAPPSSTWAAKVRFFMRKIDPIPVSFSLEG